MRRRLPWFAGKTRSERRERPSTRSPLEFPLTLAGAGVLYAVAYLLIYPFAGPAISALALAIVVPGALRYGLSGGLAFATLGTILNVYLAFGYHGYSSPKGIGAALSGTLMLYLTAVTLGLLHAALRRMRSEVRMRQHAEAQLRQLANHDSLTGLPNRRYFTERAHACVRGASPQRPCALLLLDLNGFKMINDTLGHDAGDELLRGVARRLERNLRPADFLARLGGDEFVLLLQEVTGEHDVREIADRIEVVFRAPFALSGTECHVRPSIGGAVAPTHAISAETLLAQADQAMYRAKRSGAGFVMHDDPDSVLKRRAARTVS